MTKRFARGQRVFAFFMALLMVVLSMPMNALTTVANAVTTNSDGYIEVRTVEDLYAVRNDLTAKYILMNDIDLTEATAPGGDWDFMGNGWNPIGSNDIYSDGAFSGEFDGNGHSIIGMRIENINTPSGMGTYKYVGLFSNITGSVHDLTFEGGSISFVRYRSNNQFNTYETHIGSLAGKCSGTVTNVHTRMNSIYGEYSYIGGIIGSLRDNATLVSCSNETDLSLKGHSRAYSEAYCVGGIVGFAGSKDYHDVLGESYNGVRSASIKYCYNAGTIVNNLSNDENLAYAGGIAGCLRGYSSSNAFVLSDSYNAGEVWNYDKKGLLSTSAGAGIAIMEYVAVTNCYNIANAGKYGFAYNYRGNSLSNAYFLNGTGATCTGATSLTAGQMKLQSSYAGFDFENVWIMNTEAVYPYPQLRSNPQDLRMVEGIELVSLPFKTEFSYKEQLDLTGCSIEVKIKDEDDEIISVTPDMITGYDSAKPGPQTLTVTYCGFTVSFDVVVKDKVYQPIYTIEDLYNIRDDMDGYYLLMNDIDLTEATAPGGDWDFDGRGWNPIGSNDAYNGKEFSGEFNGNGFSIIGMRIDGGYSQYPANDYYLGLFANVTGSINNLKMSNISIKTALQRDTLYCGAVAGKMTGTMTNVAVESGSIEVLTEEYGGNKAYVGGVVGYFYGDALKLVNKANVTTEVNGTNLSGDGATSYTGGVFGYLTGLNGSIKESFNTGNVYGRGNEYTSGYSAGIAGYGNDAQIVNCYNTGNVSGLDYGAGIANKGAIKKSYSSGKSNKSALQALGGTTTEGYFLNGSGSSSTGATALTETQMKIQSMYKGFDFENVWVLNPYANHPYPQLRNNIQDLSESAELVSIIALPAKTEYFTGDTLDFTGAMVKVVYVSGREEIVDITNDIVSGFDMNTVGEQKVKVTVAGASDTYMINVKERPVVESISVISPPSKTQFAIGTAFDFTGAQAMISYVGGITEYKDIPVEATSGGNINHIGKQTITYTFGGKSATFEVEVVGISLEKIVLTKLPTKLSYMEGHNLDLTGMVVTAVMNNGFESTVGEGYTVTGYSSAPGTHTVTVDYLGKTASFEVTVAERKLVSLALNTLPDKLEYISGEAFDDTGMQVIATYDNGDVEVAENYTVSDYDQTPGIKNVVVSLGDKSVSFPVKVVAKVITDFTLVSLPSKLDYIEFEALDITGLVAKATYNDGITEEITDYALAGFSSTPGVHTISVAYQGFVESFEIRVAPRILENVRITPPTKLTYQMGDEFDPAGMVVTACYNNGQEISVDNYQISGFDSLSAGAKTVSVTFGDITRSFAIVVAERSQIQTGGTMTVGNITGCLGDKVALPVSVSHNSGLAGFKHTISFDTEKLAFVSAEAQNGFAGPTLVVNDEKKNEGLVTVLWFGTEDVREDGEVYLLTFEILETKDDATTEVFITFEDNDNGNLSGENLIFTPVNGSVEIRTWWLGDLDGNRKYAIADLLLLAQYVSGKSMTMTDKQLLSADVNEDGMIDIHDVVMLQQWLLNEEI